MTWWVASLTQKSTTSSRNGWTKYMVEAKATSGPVHDCLQYLGMMFHFSEKGNKVKIDMIDYMESMFNNFPTKFKPTDVAETPAVDNLFAKGEWVTPIRMIGALASTEMLWHNPQRHVDTVCWWPTCGKMVHWCIICCAPRFSRATLVECSQHRSGTSWHRCRVPRDGTVD